jgi:DNA-binding NarL/FixJ family response regulator
MKILVVDDHHLVRDALRGVLRKLTSDVEILEAADCLQATRTIEKHPDLGLVLLDLLLPDGDGFSLLSKLRKQYPATAVVILSALQEHEHIIRAMNLGSVGFIPKSARKEVMLSALQLIIAGGIYVPPEILARRETTNGASKVNLSTTNRPTAASPSDLGLTQRQIEVLALMLQGKSNKGICRLLELSESSVKNYITTILRALKVANRTEAVIVVNELGWELPHIAQAQT